MRRLIALVVLLAVLPLAVMAADLKFPPLTGRVVDQVQVLSPAAVQQLDRQLAGFEQKTGDQVVVAIVSSLQGVPIEDYGYQLGRAWGIGQKGKNNGLIFLIAPTERKIRIEVGYGLEGTLTDAQSKLIIEDVVAPKFKAGQMQQGVVDGVQAILQTLDPTGSDVNSAPAKEANSDTHSIRIGVWFLLSLFLPLIFFILLPMLFITRLVRGRSSRLGPESDSRIGISNGGANESSSDNFSGGGGSFGGGGASGDY